LADRYWVGGTDDWDNTAGSKWATTSGGGGGSAVPTSSDNVFFDANSGAGTTTVTIDSDCLDLDFTGYTGTFDTSHNANDVNIYGSLVLVAAMTVGVNSGFFVFKATSGTETITSNGLTSGMGFHFDGSGGTFQLADALVTSKSAGTAFQLINGTFDANSFGVEMTSATTAGITGAFTGSSSFYDLTRTGTTAKNGELVLAGDIAVTNVFTVAGNSATSRIIVESSTTASSRTITAATVTVSNADFKDITGAGAASWDLSAITGESGDAGGNTDITFTTADIIYWVGDNGNWSGSSNWSTSSGGASGARVPLPQDDAVFDANSFSTTGFTVTGDMPRLGKRIDWTSATNSPTFNPSTTSSIFGSLTLIAGMTLGTHTNTYTFEGRGSFTFTTGGNSFNKQITLDAPAGTLTLQDDLTTGSSRQLKVTRGTFDANDNNLTLGNFDSGNNTTRTVSMGSGTWSFIGNAVNIWNTNTTTNLTFNEETSTIKFISALGNNKNFLGGGLTFNNFWNATTNAFYIRVAGNNTFNDFQVDASRIQAFNDGQTQTMTTFTVGDGCTIQSDTTATHTISIASGTVTVTGATISYSIATGGATFNAVSSTDGGNNTGWNFIVPFKPKLIIS